MSNIFDLHEKLDFCYLLFQVGVKRQFNSMFKRVKKWTHQPGIR